MDKKTENFLAIVDGHKRLIYKVVNAYCKNRDLHKDLTQEIILQLWSSFDSYNDQYQYSTWIYRIALNAAISFYRKGVAQSKHSSEFLPQYENIIASEAIVEEDPKLELLQQFILELKEIDKALILLYLDGLSYNEIAGITGISPTNVGTKLSRIKNNLRKKFQSIIKFNNNGR